MGSKRTPPSADTYVKRLCTRNPNLLVPHFLIHSYLYYECDTPIITDATFDWIVKRLGDQWESVEHRHKGLIDKTLLKTGYYLAYPEIVKGAGRALLEGL